MNTALARRLEYTVRPGRRDELVEAKRYRGPIRDEKLREKGHPTVVVYDGFEVLTEHGLYLLNSDLGMSPALDLMCKNADRRNEVSVFEMPSELQEINDLSGVLVRPASWQRDKLRAWVEENGAALLHYFGDGARFAALPEYEIRAFRLVEER